MKKKVIVCIVLLLLFAANFYLRIKPVIGKPVDFTRDNAFHYRMTKLLVEQGRLPDIDYLTTYPEGRRVSFMAPPGIYYLAAWFHHLVRLIAPLPIERSILLFGACIGSCLLFPLYLLACTLYRSRLAACLAAGTASIIPGYLHRSLSYWYRYELAGTPILFFALYFFIRAFTAKDHKTHIRYALAFLLAMVAALYTWRLSGLFLGAYFIAIFYCWLRMPEQWRVNRRNLLVITAGICLTLPWLAPGFGIASPYYNSFSFPKAIVQITLQRIGIHQNLSEYARLLYETTELAGVSLVTMFNQYYFSFAGFAGILFLVLYFLRTEISGERDIIFIFLSYFLLLTVVFLRMKNVLAPLVGLGVGEAVVLLYQQKRLAARVLLCLGLLLVCGRTAFDAYRLSSTRGRSILASGKFKAAMQEIRKRTPENAVILSNWSDGYEIQTYCRRPTLTDGLLESPQVIERTVTLSDIIFSHDPQRLLRFCQRYGAGYILMPRNKTKALATYANLKVRDYFYKGKPTVGGKDTVIAKLITPPFQLPFFKHLYDNSEFVLYEVDSPDAYR